MPALAAGGWHHTPARAGSTSVFGEDEAVDESHSRLRGEHRELLHRSPYRGTIPACAGSTEAVGLRGVVRGDHPRMRGEHTT